MATLWSKIGDNIVATSPYQVTLTPDAGDLMILYWCASPATTAYSSAAASDTGSGGWTQLDFLVPATSQTSMAAWWKIATALDNNGGAGITITVTASGGVGVATSITTGVENYRVTGPNPATGIDLHATPRTGTGSGSPAVTVSAAAGSGQAANTDELAWAMLGTNLTNSGLGTWSFTGTSSTAAMTTGGTNIASVGYVGGVQASATAATNVWSLSWSAFRFYGIIAATFYYPQAQQVMIA